jgi:hypothetical protein
MRVLTIFGISALMILVSSGLIAQLCLWPWLRTMNHHQALLVLASPHMFLRFIGLSLLVPGVVSSSLPAGFAARRVWGFCRLHPCHRREGRSCTTHAVGHATPRYRTCGFGPIYLSN